ncbi:hypothetical protein L6164_000368 [Bauhinia variegata]|uniref:Uncharacterized protein n=1 Tax=Bauhinia variegata TaxID=167791 RepID=A0ACB9Q6A7_BAUVA|nr:hypothetical protein L6164_000368 [Bauhinia variegata]
MVVPLLKLVIFASATLWSFLTRFIFSSIAFLLLMFIQAFKVPGEAIHEGLRQIAEIIRACLEFVLEMMMEAISFLLSKVFDAIKDSIAGSLEVTGSVAGGLAERMKASLDEILKDLPELWEDISDFISKMVADFWENFREAVGYVTENA